MNNLFFVIAIVAFAVLFFGTIRSLHRNSRLGEMMFYVWCGCAVGYFVGSAVWYFTAGN